MAFRVMKSPLYDLSRHPDFAKELGLISASWSLVDYQLCNLFAFILRAPPWRAHPAFYSIVSNRARVDAIRAAARDMIDRETFGDRLDKLLDRANTVARERNGYIHKLWLVEGSKLFVADKLGANFPRGKKRTPRVTEMRATKRRIIELADDLAAFIREYSSKHPVFLTEEPHPSLLNKS